VQEVVDHFKAMGLEPIIVDDAADLAHQLDGILRKRETNVEFITRIMNYCPQGALGQVVVLHALEGYCNMVEHFDESEFDNPMLSGSTWKDTCKWMQSEIDKHFAKG